MYITVSVIEISYNECQDHKPMTIETRIPETKLDMSIIFYCKSNVKSVY